jgi:hypothetical protein
MPEKTNVNVFEADEVELAEMKELVLGLHRGDPHSIGGYHHPILKVQIDPSVSNLLKATRGMSDEWRRSRRHRDERVGGFEAPILRMLARRRTAIPPELGSETYDVCTAFAEVCSNDAARATALQIAAMFPPPEEDPPSSQILV